MKYIFLGTIQSGWLNKQAERYKKASAKLKQLGINTVTPEEGFKDADIIAILNNHKKYMDLDINSLIKTSNKPLLFLDTWHIFTKESISQDKVFYSGLSFDQF